MSHSVPLPPCSNPATAAGTGGKGFMPWQRSQTPLGTTERAEEFTVPSDLVYTLPSPPSVTVATGYPKTQGEVNQDFSKVKAPSSQVPIHQFQNWVNDHYLRSFGEDDLAFLASEFKSFNGCPTVRVHVPSPHSTAAASTTTASVAPPPGGGATHDGSPATLHNNNNAHHHADIHDKTGASSRDMTYDIPALGRHYSEVWRDEDQELSPTKSQQQPDPDLRMAPSKLTVMDLAPDVLATEKVHLGPFAERLVSAIHPRPAVAPSSDPVADPLPPPHTTGPSPPPPPPPPPHHHSGPAAVLPNLKAVDHGELEQRVTQELQLLGVLGATETMSWTGRADDEISRALRRTQSVLAVQSGRNGVRKSVLAGRVRERMAAQEFDTIKEGLERLLAQQKYHYHHPTPSRAPIPDPALQTKIRNTDLAIAATLHKRRTFLDSLGPLLLRQHHHHPNNHHPHDGPSDPLRFDPRDLAQIVQIPNHSIYQHLLPHLPPSSSPAAADAAGAVSGTGTETGIGTGALRLDPHLPEHVVALASHMDPDLLAQYTI
ncbi:hypothetical protein PCASD_24376 [Puccinia coronata f. sp. avenae]|uniref:Uncharacterized protein n=1 Tax=Puccinia coronata f. sp. avenae TaxID=200324 RepID=A0A2N5S3I3_9BASI|nr:hypothetical protein PCASD_24376 [Puccinia coronata f. sp. avenae]